MYVYANAQVRLFLLVLFHYFVVLIFTSEIRIKTIIRPGLCGHLTIIELCYRKISVESISIIIKKHMESISIICRSEN